MCVGEKRALLQSLVAASTFTLPATRTFFHPPPPPPPPPRLTLLHDGQISGEVGVKHVVEAQRALRRHHLPRLHRPGRQPQLLADRHPHRGRGLHHHHLQQCAQKTRALEGGRC